MRAIEPDVMLRVLLIADRVKITLLPSGDQSGYVPNLLMGSGMTPLLAPIGVPFAPSRSVMMPLRASTMRVVSGLKVIQPPLYLGFSQPITGGSSMATFRTPSTSPPTL